MLHLRRNLHQLITKTGGFRDILTDCIARCLGILWRTKPRKIVLTSFSPKRPLRVFIALRDAGWEYEGLVKSWEEIAYCYYHDDLNAYNPYSENWHENEKRIANENIINALRKFSAKGQCDLFFGYLSGRWLIPGFAAEISKLPRLSLNISFDDTPGFWGDRMIDEHWSGTAEISKEFDLNVTCQNAHDLLKYRMVGAKAIFMPPEEMKRVILQKSKLRKRGRA